MNANKALEIIASKWFVLILGLGMLGVLPITYSNLMLVFYAGEMSRVWWVPTVFTCNLLAAMMSVYKATGMFFSKKDDEPEEWEDD